MKALNSRISSIIFSIALGNCYHGAWGPIRAKKDYEAYPDYRKEIALYNIKEILTDPHMCKTAQVDQNEFSCEWVECTRYTFGYSTNHQTGQIEGSNTCSNTMHHSTSEYWRNIKSVSAEGTCLKFNSRSSCDLMAFSTSQAQDLEEAIIIYLQERDKK